MSDPVCTLAPLRSGAAAREPGDELAVVVLAAPSPQVQRGRVVERRPFGACFRLLQLGSRGGAS
jgi:hypothetical protein